MSADAFVASILSTLDLTLSSLTPLLPPHLPPQTHLLVAFTALFIAVRCLIAWPFVRVLLGFSSGNYATASAASSVVCFLHGGPVAAAAGFLCYDQYMQDTVTFEKIMDISSSIATYDDTYQQLARVTLTFSAAYMLYDAVFMLINAYCYGGDKEPYLVSFLLHHFGCCLVMFSVYFYGSGYTMLMVLIFLGEVTNPMQNALNICLHGLSNGQKSPWKTLRSVIEPIFAVFFAVIRLILGPPITLYYFYHFGYQTLTGSVVTNVPYLVGLVWCIVTLAMVHGSVPFAMEKLAVFSKKVAATKKKKKN